MNKEAIGFILADGSCMIIKQNRKRKYKDKVYNFIGYVPKIAVSQRSDNLETLKWFKEQYGGYVMANTSFKPPHYPVHYWQITTFEGCRKLSRDIMNSAIPHKKKEAAKILNQFCRYRLAKGKGKIGDQSEMEKMYLAIREANKFKA